jgi:hypothetical protein
MPIGVQPEDEGLQAEFMVVLVHDGTFAVDLQPDAQGNVKQVLVSTLGSSITTLHPRTNDPPYYAPDSTLKDSNGRDCTRACAVKAGEPVQLGPGDLAVAEAGALCIYCLLNSGQIGVDDEQGTLEVYVLLNSGAGPNDFSWIQSWQRAQNAASRTGDARTMIGWALLNPNTGCRGH